MSEPAFTEGPWRVDASGRYVSVWDENFVGLLADTNIGGFGANTQKANAKLMACAPTMYNILAILETELKALLPRASQQINEVLAIARGEVSP